MITSLIYFESNKFRILKEQNPEVKIFFSDFDFFSEKSRIKPNFHVIDQIFFAILY